MNETASFKKKDKIEKFLLTLRGETTKIRDLKGKPYS